MTDPVTTTATVVDQVKEAAGPAGVLAGVTALVAAVAKLGKMAFGILRAFLSRLKSLGMVKDLPDLSVMLRQFQARDTAYEEIEFEIREEERPPMNTIPAYRKKMGLD